MVRTGKSEKLVEAMQHAKKYLAPYMETKSKEIHRAAGLLAFPSNTETEPYKVFFFLPLQNFSFEVADLRQSLYSPSRWEYLANLFMRTHHELLSLPSRPLLHIALSAGLSSLKTPSCHSAYASSRSNSQSTSTSVCPICSVELNELARNVPYAHHTKSYVEHDSVILPNGRMYGRERLLEASRQVGKGKIKDPTTGEIFDESEMKKIYIM